MSTIPDAGLPNLSDVAAVGKAIWWMVLIRGIAAVVFGILAIVFPGVTMVALAILFAAYSLIDGVLTIVHALRVRTRHARWGWLLAQGVISVITGLVVSIFPVTAGVVGGLIVVYTIAFWSIFSGFAGFPAAAAMADGGRKVWAYVAAALSVLFGISLVVIGIVTPLEAINALVVVIGAYAIIGGLVLIVVAIGVRGTAKKLVRSRGASPAV